MMVASTIITDDKSTEDLQKQFGEILDENVVLKETLKQNNDSMKEQVGLLWKITFLQAFIYLAEYFSSYFNKILLWKYF